MTVVSVERRHSLGYAPVDCQRRTGWQSRGFRGLAVAAALQCGIAMGSNFVRTNGIAADTASDPVLGTEFAAPDSCTLPRKSVAGTYTPALVPSASSHRPIAVARSGNAHVLPRVCQEPRALPQVPVGWQAREPKRGKRERRRR